MRELILQDRLPEAPWAEASFRRLPGTRPVGPDDWIFADEVYAEQMMLKERLIEERRDEVVALVPGAEAAATEVLTQTLNVLRTASGFTVDPDSVDCPDGRRVAIRRDEPLATVGRLVQEDVCILQRSSDEHVLVAALLCFPSGWTLAEKLGKPLTRIHRPVPSYDAEVGHRVQRLFDGLKVGKPLTRSNLLWQGDAQLFAPRKESDPHRRVAPDEAAYLRSERQCLLRLPASQAVLFTIHTTIVETSRLSQTDQAALKSAPPAKSA